MLRIIILLILFISKGVLFSQTNQSTVNFPKDIYLSEINVSIFDNVIYLPISVNNNPPVDFVLDTGAPELSIIEAEITKKYKLDTKSGGNLSGAGENQVKFSFIEKARLTVGDINIINPRLGTISLVHMEPYWGKPKHGLLGGNVLKDLITEINYVNKTVKFYKPENFSYQGMGKKIPVKIIDNSIFITAKIQLGEEKVFKGKFLIDTAVRNTFFNSPFTRKHQLIEKSNEIVENITGFGLGGVGFGKQSRIKSLELGGYLLNEPIVELTTDKKGIAASKTFDGIIGADILSRFTLILDYANKEIILCPNKNFNDTFEYDKSGIYLILDINDQNIYKVAHVIPGSPASNAGIFMGDIIIEVDNISSKYFNYEELKNYFKQDNKTINLKIMRNKELIDIDIKLEKLL